jgi:rare lipoprotein A (peptidoglycan hydrolase)
VRPAALLLGALLAILAAQPTDSRQPTPPAPAPCLRPLGAATSEASSQRPSLVTNSTPSTARTPLLSPASPPAMVMGIRGTASWYATGPAGVAAAGGPLRAALGPSWRGARVVVSAGGRSAVVTLGDWCACPGGRVIDLDPGAFRAVCGPLPRGLCEVTVSR